MPVTLAIVLRPRITWEGVGRAAPAWTTSLLRHALPLALLPAIAWPAGQALTGASHMASAGDMAGSFASTVILTLASLLIVALAIYALSPFFEVPRSWDRAMAVSAYSSTPVLLAGTLLFVPVLVIASVAAFLHSLVLCSVGLNVLLGCRESDCPAFVASVAVATGIASMALGALCSAIGLI